MSNESDLVVQSRHAGRSAAGFWRSLFRVLRTFRTLILVLVLSVSLAANAALFVGGVLYNFVDEALESIVGLDTATARQNRENRDLRKKNSQLNQRVAKYNKVANGAVERTIQRSTAAVTRSVITLPGKAIPYIGMPVVVGVTALEVDDFCSTLEDMREIQRELELDETPIDGETRICDTELPTKDEIEELIKSKPREILQSSREYLPDIEFHVIEGFPEIIDNLGIKSENIFQDLLDLATDFLRKDSASGDK